MLSANWNYNSHQTNLNLILLINLILLYERWDINAELILICIYSVLYKSVYCLFTKPNLPLCSWMSPPTPPTKRPQTFYLSEFGSDNSYSGPGWGLSGRFGVARQPCCWQQESSAQHFEEKIGGFFFSLSLLSTSSVTWCFQVKNLIYCFSPPYIKLFFSLQDCQYMPHMLEHINVTTQQWQKKPRLFSHEWITYIAVSL